MKLPILNVTSLPSFYKHCAGIQLLHIELQNEGMQETATFADDYLSYIREQIYQAVETFFITSLATRITSHGETYVIFKSNTEKTILANFVEALFAEVDLYCEQHITLSYQYMEAMLFLEGTPVKMFRSGKLGEEVKESAQYKKHTVLYNHKKKPRGKQLLSVEEYRAQYAKLQKAKQSSSTKRFDRNNHDTQAVSTKDVEDICEYYI